VMIEAVEGVTANMGFSLTGEALEAAAEVAGRYEDGVIVSPEAALNDLQLAWMACGQDQLVASPLQMALVTAAVANGGTIMEPHLVYQVVAQNGALVSSTAARAWRTAMDPATATQLNLMMQKVVAEGTGTGAAIAGVKVAGKTGTAETGRKAADGSRTDQAWFIGFAPADDPKVVVCVSIENSTSTGGAIAAPIAAEVMRAVLAQASLP